MNPRTLLILTVLVAVLGGFIFFVEKDMPSTDERREQEKKVLAIEKDDVRALEIAWDDTSVRLERQDPPSEEDEEDDGKGDVFAKPQPEWRLLEPLRARADKTGVESLLTTLTGLEKERTLDGVERSQLGFDEARGRVTLTTDKGETVIEIGPDVAASSDMLVAVGDAFYQVANSVWSDLTKRPGDWRDKTIFTAGRQDIERLTLTSGDAQVLLAKRGDDFWIESPLTDLADDEQVNGFLSEVTSLKAETFVDGPAESAADFGLDPASHVLEVVLAGESEAFRLELGNARDEGETLYARYGEQVVEVKTRLAESFAKTPEEWRSRDWTPLQVFRVDAAHLEDAAGTVEVTRADSDWLRGDDRVSYSAVSDVLYALSDAKAEEVLTREEVTSRGHVLGDPVLRVTLDTEDDSQSLALYPSVEGFSAATRDGRDAVLLLAAETVDEVTSKLKELRQAEPLPDEEEDEDEEDQDEASE